MTSTMGGIVLPEESDPPEFRVVDRSPADARLPVFVDATGRRRRALKLTVAGAALACGGYLAVVGVGFVGGDVGLRGLLPWSHTATTAPDSAAAHQLSTGAYGTGTGVSAPTTAPTGAGGSGTPRDGGATAPTAGADMFSATGAGATGSATAAPSPVRTGSPTGGPGSLGTTAHGPDAAKVAARERAEAARADAKATRAAARLQRPPHGTTPGGVVPQRAL